MGQHDNKLYFVIGSNNFYPSLVIRKESSYDTLDHVQRDEGALHGDRLGHSCWEAWNYPQPRQCCYMLIQILPESRHSQGVLIRYPVGGHGRGGRPGRRGAALHHVQRGEAALHRVRLGHSCLPDLGKLRARLGRLLVANGLL